MIDTASMTPEEYANHCGKMSFPAGQAKLLTPAKIAEQLLRTMHARQKETILELRHRLEVSDRNVTEARRDVVAAEEEVAKLTTKLDVRLNSHNVTLDKLNAKQDKCESLFANNEALRKEVNDFLESLNQSTKERNGFLQDVEFLKEDLKAMEADRDYHAGHAEKLLGDYHDTFIDLGNARRDVDRFKYSAWLMGLGWFLLSICWIIKLLRETQ